jgi:membrane protein DedA with SNARE-associated domain
MSFWQAYKFIAATLLAGCLWFYLLVAVNEFIVANLTGYLQGLAFAVWNPLWIALVIGYCTTRDSVKEEKKVYTDEELHYQEYDH